MLYIYHLLLFLESYLIFKEGNTQEIMVLTALLVLLGMFGIWVQWYAKKEWLNRYF